MLLVGPHLLLVMWLLLEVGPQLLLENLHRLWLLLRLVEIVAVVVVVAVVLGGGIGVGTIGNQSVIESCRGGGDICLTIRVGPQLLIS